MSDFPYDDLFSCFLQTLLRSDGGVGDAISLEGIELGVGGVFVGEIR